MPSLHDVATPSGSPESFVHPLAEVDSTATLGAGCKVWRYSHIRENASLGDNCIIGAGVYVGGGVRLGANCKVQNQALLYEGVELGDGVFVGPQVCFTNDREPRAVNADGSLKAASDWHVGKTRVETGASIGASSVIVTGITVGAWALVGAGAVVTRDVPSHALVVGSPARIRGWVCRCAGSLLVSKDGTGRAQGVCQTCQSTLTLPALALENAPS